MLKEPFERLFAYGLKSKIENRFEKTNEQVWDQFKIAKKYRFFKISFLHLDPLKMDMR
jgi:hypothetical protein